MPGRVPIRNGKFSNAPDFTNQGVTGITGSGVFRSFIELNTGGGSITLQSAYLWYTLQIYGNSIVTIPDNTTLGANVGDEIIIVNFSGLTSFLTSGPFTILLGSSTANILPAECPARLIYLGNVAGYGSQCWILTGLKTSITANNTYDCCGNGVNTVYTLGELNTSNIGYANEYGTSLYTSTNLGGVVVVGSEAYTITSGVITDTSCSEVSFTYLYTFYDNGGNGVSLYTYLDGLTITDDAQITNVPFKTSSGISAYVCNTDYAASGTYYRSVNMYGPSSPVCFTNGIVTSFASCL